MSLGRQVPWSSWAEWRQVGLWLLSQEPQEAQRGLDRVSDDHHHVASAETFCAPLYRCMAFAPFAQVAAWRVRGRVPLGVDSTAALVEAAARDHALASAGAGAAAAAGSEHELRLQYSMALVRMVNGIADSAQRGRLAASVASLAGAAGLPRLLVDLRHEATHNELPSLAALRCVLGGGAAPGCWRRTSSSRRACGLQVGS